MEHSLPGHLLRKRRAVECSLATRKEEVSVTSAKSQKILEVRRQYKDGNEINVGALCSLVQENGFATALLKRN